MTNPNPLDDVVKAAIDPRAVHAYIVTVTAVDAVAGTVSISTVDGETLTGITYFGGTPVNNTNALYLTFDDIGVVVGYEDMAARPVPQAFTAHASLVFASSQTSSAVTITFPAGRFSGPPSLAGGALAIFVIVRASALSATSCTVLGWTYLAQNLTVDTSLMFVYAPTDMTGFLAVEAADGCPCGPAPADDPDLGAASCTIATCRTAGCENEGIGLHVWTYAGVPVACGPCRLEITDLTDDPC